ncbi:MAG: SAV_2336 N-terminal domain-related protein [Catenulispora sp.]
MPDDERTALADYVEALASADLSARELAEALWLADWIARSTTQAPDRDRAGPDAVPPARIPVSVPTPSATGQRATGSPQDAHEAARGTEHPSPDPDRSEPSDAEASDHGSGASPVRVPAPVGSEAVRFARSLRRLRPLPVRRSARTADAATALDEAATARFAAETGLLWPVRERVRPRRGIAKVVVDTSVSMQVWSGLEDDIVSGLALSSVFRRVELWTLHRRADTAMVAKRAPAGQPERPLARLADRSGDSAIVILSDGVSRLWYSGDVSAAARDLAAHCPVAVIEPLPNRLWRRTGLQPQLATVAGAARGLARFHLARIASEGATPAVPILEADESWLAKWAGLASGRHTSARFAVLGARAPAGPIGNPVGTGAGVPVPPSGDGWATPAVRRFRAAASQGARELAVALSIVPLSLPIMQMVLTTCFPNRSRSHLAEVITGGLMERDPAVRGDQDPPVFRWLPGVGEELRREVDERRTEEVYAALARYLDSELGFRSGRRAFPAFVGVAGGFPDPEGHVSTPFASILRATAQRALNRPATTGSVPGASGDVSGARRVARALALARAARESGRSTEIDEAIEAVRLAVNGIASRDWAATAALVDLLESRSHSSESVPDLEEAVIVLREYADRVPAADPHRRECLERLADTLLRCYRATESSDYLDHAIRVRRELADGDDAAASEQVMLLADSLLEHHRLTGSSLSVYEAADLMGELRARDLPDELRAPATAILARGLDVMSRSTRDEEDIAAADEVWLALMADLGDLSGQQALAVRSAIEARIGFHRASGRGTRARVLEEAFARARDRLGPDWGSAAP